MGDDREVRLWRDVQNSVLKNGENHALVMVGKEDVHKLVDIVAVSMPLSLELASWDMRLIVRVWDSKDGTAEADG